LLAHLVPEVSAERGKSDKVYKHLSHSRGVYREGQILQSLQAFFLAHLIPEVSTERGKCCKVYKKT
jgi:hypothetical protein